jgi:hypothetical protein
MGAMKKGCLYQEFLIIMKTLSEARSGSLLSGIPKGRFLCVHLTKSLRCF